MRQPRLALGVSVLGLLVVLWFPPWRATAVVQRSPIIRVTWAAGVHPLTAPPQWSDPRGFDPRFVEYRIDAARLAIHLATAAVFGLIVGFTPLPRIRMPPLPKLRTPPKKVVVVGLVLITLVTVVLVYVALRREDPYLRAAKEAIRDLPDSVKR